MNESYSVIQTGKDVEVVKRDIVDYCTSDLVGNEFEVVADFDNWIDAKVKETELNTGITMEQFFKDKQEPIGGNE